MLGRIRGFLSDNIVFVVGLPCIAGFHWCWLQLQKIDKLVPPEQRTLEQPIVRATRIVHHKLKEKYGSTAPDLESTNKPQEAEDEVRNH